METKTKTVGKLRSPPGSPLSLTGQNRALCRLLVGAIGGAPAPGTKAAAGCRPSSPARRGCLACWLLLSPQLLVHLGFRDSYGQESGVLSSWGTTSPEGDCEVVVFVSRTCFCSMCWMEMDLSKRAFLLFRGQWHIARAWGLAGCEGRQLLSFD